MSQKPLLVVVLGYGCHLDKTMKDYLMYVAALSSFRMQGTQKVTILTTGGFTNQKSAPETSEAGMMRNYLRSKYLSCKICADTEALTTEDNILAIKKFVTQGWIDKNLTQISDYEIIIFGSKSRESKIRGLGNSILKSEFTIFGFDFGESFIERLKQEYINTPLDLLAHRFQPIKEMQISRKKKIIAIS